MRPIAIVRGALLAAAVSIVTLAPAAAAQAPDAPAERYAVGSPAMAAAQEIARAYWGTDPCGGVVTIEWTRLEPNVNALSSWTVTGGPYDDPETNHDCTIEFNTQMDFTWAKFCTVLVHEYGHLVGHPHVDDEHDLMSPVYTRPIAECAPKVARRASLSRRSARLSRGA
ncbi:MAG TPA: matrixin family metalloprotease [Capillimicrobium sp.]|nr:matrixin family metalloprotease [Capillimicrobium sp.]